MKEFLDSVLTLKIVVCTVPKKGLMILLPHLGKLSLQIRTRINCVVKSKLSYCNFRIVFQTNCKLINFFTYSKIKFLFSYILALFMNFIAMAAMIPIMIRLSIIFKVRMCEHFWIFAVTGKRVKGHNDSENIIYFAIIHLVLTIFPY